MPEGQFRYPHSVAIGPQGTIYVADNMADQVQAFTPEGTFLFRWGSHGAGAGQFAGPRGLTVDVPGNVYVSDTGNERVEKFTATGDLISIWPGLRTANPRSSISRRGWLPTPLEEIYVADTGHHRVLRFTKDGALLGSIGSLGAHDGQFDFSS